MHRLILRSFGLQLCGLCLLAAAVGLSSAKAQQSTKNEVPVAYPALSYLEANKESGPENASPPVMLPSSALIISNFIAAETRFRETAISFSFKRDVLLQTIGAHGEVTGEYVRKSVFVLNDQGERIEQVLYHPKPSIKAMKITKEDIQDLAGSQLFGLEATDLNAYHLAYQGEETLAGQPAYLVRVTPKQQPDPNNMRVRFFVGLIWIDKTNFQILKLRGTTEPHGKQRFPAFQTTRDLRIENLLFPSATDADDVLHFSHKDVHYLIHVKYYDFKRFASRLKIVDIDG